MTQVFLAMIAPDHEGPTVLGVFSTLELAQLAFDDKEHPWVFSPQYQQYWQADHPVTNGRPIMFGDNEIHPLTLDEHTTR